MVLCLSESFSTNQIQGSDVVDLVTSYTGGVEFAGAILPRLCVHVAVEVWREPRKVDICEITRARKTKTKNVRFCQQWTAVILLTRASICKCIFHTNQNMHLYEPCFSFKADSIVTIRTDFQQGMESVS